jgi:hypothetical protein
MNEAETRAELIDSTHLDVLRRIIGSAEDVSWSRQKNPRAIATAVSCLALAETVPPQAEARCQLLAAVPGALDNIEALALRILAWGGIRTKHAAMLFKEKDKRWLDLCRQIAAGSIDRRTGFDRFAALRRNSGTQGMGAAYYTKLIYFLMPRSNTALPIGYIMDQWVGCSINLLVQSPFIRIGSNFVVSDGNDGSIYERYCRTVEQVAQECALTPEELEMQLMSKGGKRKASWRAFVIENRKPNP